MKKEYYVRLTFDGSEDWKEISKYKMLKANEEKTIKHLQLMQKDFEKCIEFRKAHKLKKNEYYTNSINAIQGILYLYEAEKQRNKRLKIYDKLVKNFKVAEEIDNMWINKITNIIEKYNKLRENCILIKNGCFCDECTENCSINDTQEEFIELLKSEGIEDE